MVKDAILKLRGVGKTYMQIKAEVGCAVSTISYYCGEGQKEKTKARNEKRRKNPDRTEQIKKILEKYINNDINDEIIIMCKQILEKNGYQVEKLFDKN